MNWKIWAYKYEESPKLQSVRDTCPANKDIGLKVHLVFPKCAILDANADRRGSG